MINKAMHSTDHLPTVLMPTLTRIRLVESPALSSLSSLSSVLSKPLYRKFLSRHPHLANAKTVMSKTLQSNDGQAGDSGHLPL